MLILKGLTATVPRVAFSLVLAQEKAAGLRGLRPALQVLLVKKKMRQLGCRTPGLYLDVPERDYSKIRFALKEKARARFGKRALQRRTLQTTKRGQPEMAVQPLRSVDLDRRAGGGAG